MNPGTIISLFLATPVVGAIAFWFLNDLIQWLEIRKARRRHDR